MNCSYRGVNQRPLKATLYSLDSSWRLQVDVLRHVVKYNEVFDDCFYGSAYSDKLQANACWIAVNRGISVTYLFFAIALQIPRHNPAAQINASFGWLPERQPRTQADGNGFMIVRLLSLPPPPLWSPPPPPLPRQRPTVATQGRVTPHAFSFSVCSAGVGGGRRWWSPCDSVATRWATGFRWSNRT